MRQIVDQTTATVIRSTLLRYDIQASDRLDEERVRTLLKEPPSGDTIMQTLLSWSEPILTAGIMDAVLH